MGFLLFSGSAMAQPVQAEALKQPSYVVALTAYNAVSEQTDGNPLETASGAYSNPEVIAARSQDLASELPFGTIIELDGPAAAQENCGFGVVAARIGYRVIGDAMNARYTNRVDVLLHTDKDYTTIDKGMKNAAEILGICKGVTVRVVGYVDINHIPTTQAALAKLVAGGTALALK
jgi:3D (Asp-Asp-Asp) domain-containing protein